MENNNIMVSIIMPVYNHERYLKEAIESVINQKVTFKIELLIGEDCSPDHSRDICRYYDNKYDFVKVYYREKNMGAMSNIYDLSCRAQGKYIASLEGDDYWNDNNKLQKQVDFLESNEDYIGCCHLFDVVDEKGIKYYDRDVECQFFKGEIYTKKEFEKGILPSHINALVFKNIYKDESIDTDFLCDFSNLLGDITIVSILIRQGKIYCFPDVMSCYRKVIDSGSSFSARNEHNNIRDKIFESQMYLQSKFNGEISFAARKKAVFASAVFKWYRSKDKRDYQVVRNIINGSKQQLLYTIYFAYLVSAKKVVSLLFKEDKRIRF